MSADINADMGIHANINADMNADIKSSSYPCAVFSMKLDRNSSAFLKQGAILIKKTKNSSGVIIEATSGLTGYQYVGSWLVKGKGCIPPSEAIKPSYWSISTSKIWLGNVKGVEGSFYAIDPYEVSLPTGTRSSFGIHFDANIPGSAGCPVIRLQKHWDLYRGIMEDFNEQGIYRIPLQVVYST